jgi:uncharacterized Zn-finger protein
MASNLQEKPNTSALPPHKTVYVQTDRVSCDGGGGALGHPKVYYDLDENGEAHCFYCCAHFIRK